MLLIALAPGSVASASTPGSVGNWVATTPLPTAISQAGAAVYNGYAYVVGDGATIEYAKIQADGTIALNGWTTNATDLPQSESSVSVQAYNGYLYSFGGRGGSGNVWTNSVYYAPINADGSVGTWATGPSLPQTLTEANTIVYGGYVYVLGGDNNDYAENTIYTAQINANGTLGAWNTLSETLPVYASDASTTVFDGYLYYITGKNCTLASDGGTCYQNLAYTAPLGSNGSIGAFTQQSNVPPEGTYSSAFTSENGYIFIAGGDGSVAKSPTDVVYSAALGPNGYLGTWAAQTPLLEPIYAESSVAYNGNLYVIGGQTSGSPSSVDTVYYTGVYGALAANLPSSLGPTSATNDSYTNSNKPAFTFSQSDPNNPTPNVQFEIDISANSNYSSPVVDYTSAFGSVGSASFTVGQSAGSGTYSDGTSGQTLPDGGYYWRVRTINTYLVASGFTDGSSSGTAFRVDTTPPTVPGAPSTTSPTTNTTPTWTWVASTDTGSGLAATPYTVEWSQSSTFSSNVQTSTSSVASFTQPSSLNVGTWYLRVNALDAAGNRSAYGNSGSVVIESPPVSGPTTTSTGSGSSTSTSTVGGSPTTTSAGGGTPTSTIPGGGTPTATNPGGGIPTGTKAKVATSGRTRTKVATATRTRTTVGARTGTNARDGTTTGAHLVGGTTSPSAPISGKHATSDQTTNTAIAVAPSPKVVFLNFNSVLNAGKTAQLNLVQGQRVRFAINGQNADIAVVEVRHNFVLLAVHSGAIVRHARLQAHATDQFVLSGNGKPKIAVTLRMTKSGIAHLALVLTGLLPVNSASRATGSSRANSIAYRVVVPGVVVILGFLWWLVLAARRRRRQDE